MAEFSDIENPFNCPICLHLLKSPVTTSCGHSFCKACLNECWDQEDQKGLYSCPQCRQTFSTRPALSKNTVLAAAVERMKTEAPEEVTTPPAASLAVSGDVECDICTETKLKAIKSCLACLASYCESHIQTHYTSAALKRHKLVNASPHLLDQICSQHDKILELYCCKDKQLMCVQCALINHQNHKMTSPATERQNIQVQFKGHQDDLQTKMQQRETKVKELRKAMDSHKLSAEAAVKHCEKLFTDLIRSMTERQAGITKMIRAQEQAEITKVEEIIMKIEDDIYVIQNFPSLSCYQCSDLSNISISQCLTFEEIETVVSELKSQLDHLCKEDIVRISEKVPTVHVTVNKDIKIKNYLPSQPKTRQEFLMYSSDLNLYSPTSNGVSLRNSKSASMNINKPASRQGYGYDVYDKYTYQVLCREKVSGRCYFEIQFEGESCSIAFSYDFNNLRSFIFGSNNRSWKCDFPTANLHVWHNQQTNTSLVSKIGVFLDQTAKTVSFYNVSDKMTLLYRIPFALTEPVHPGFSFREGGSCSSVTICDLSKLKK